MDTFITNIYSRGIKAQILLLSLSLIFLTQAEMSLAQDSPVVADGAELNLVADQFSFTEGPASDAEGNVYFTDQPNNDIWVYTTGEELELFMDESGRSNGMYFDEQGNLITCADAENELWSITPYKEVSVLIDDYDGRRLNGPNDLWIDPNTDADNRDPYYQRPYWDRDEPDIKEQRVYYLSPDRNELTMVADDVVKPNGIIGTPDGKTLYVADIGDQKTYSFAINSDGSLSDQTLFTDMGSDGMTIDDQGNIYLTGDGVHVFNSEGQKIDHIPVPQNWTANVTFGGPDHDMLFITASTAVYTLDMKVNGR